MKKSKKKEADAVGPAPASVNFGEIDGGFGLYPYLKLQYYHAFAAVSCVVAAIFCIDRSALVFQTKLIQYGAVEILARLI